MREKLSFAVLVAGALMGAAAFLTPAAGAQPNFVVDPELNFVGIGRDFRITGNEVFGIRYVGVANAYGGMYVETSHAQGWPFYGFATNGSFRAWTYYDGSECPDPCPPSQWTDRAGWTLYQQGIKLKVPLGGGLRIGPSADYSLVINNSTGSDGVRIYDTADDAIQIGSDPNYSNYGVYIPSPGVSTYGLWPNTAEANGEWALFTVDNIQAGNVSAFGITQIARVSGDAELQPGDVVGAVGVEAGMAGVQDLVPSVAAAGGVTSEAVIGVVRSRMALVPLPGKEGADAMGLHPVAGPARAGDFVAVVVQGVALVRADPSAAIAAGQRLTAADLPGLARPLETRLLDGMVVTEGATAVGVALGPSEDGLVPVYVRSR